MPDQLAYLTEAIQNLSKTPDRPIIVAISGFGGAGKTTIAQRLSEQLTSCYIIHMDDFIVKNRIYEDSVDKDSYDRVRLEQQVLLPLSRGKRAKFQKFVWAENLLSDFVQIPESSYIIVEGISAYHPDIAHYYNLRVWINTDLETATERGRQRDKDTENTKFWSLCKENDRKYFNKYSPLENADFVLDNN